MTFGSFIPSGISYASRRLFRHSVVFLNARGWVGAQVERSNYAFSGLSAICCRQPTIYCVQWVSRQPRRLAAFHAHLDSKYKRPDQRHRLFFSKRFYLFELSCYCLPNKNAAYLGIRRRKLGPGAKRDRAGEIGKPFMARAQS